MSDLEPITSECNRPIADAAAEVSAAAAKAREMMEQVQSSRLWALLTAQGQQKSKV